MSAATTSLAYVLVDERVHIRMPWRNPKTLYLYVLTLPTTISEDLGLCVVMGNYLLHERFVDDRRYLWLDHGLTRQNWVARKLRDSLSHLYVGDTEGIVRMPATSLVDVVVGCRVHIHMPRCHPKLIVFICGSPPRKMKYRYQKVHAVWKRTRSTTLVSTSRATA